MMAVWAPLRDVVTAAVVPILIVTAALLLVGVFLAALYRRVACIPAIKKITIRNRKAFAAWELVALIVHCGVSCGVAVYRGLFVLGSFICKVFLLHTRYSGERRSQVIGFDAFEATMHIEQMMNNPMVRVLQEHIDLELSSRRALK